MLLLIRPAQMKALGRGTEAFEGKLAELLGRQYPALVRVLGPERLRLLVAQGVDGARERGLTQQGPVRLFVEAQLLWGHRFFDDPQLPSVSALFRKRPMEQKQRALELHQCLSRYLLEAIGPQQDFAAAQRRKRRFLEEFAPAGVKDEEHFAERMHASLRRCDAPRVLHAGPKAVQALIVEAERQARTFGFPSSRGRALFVALLWLFGHGCSDDPLLPWLSPLLLGPRTEPESDRLQAIEKACFDWFARLLAAEAEETA